MIDGCVSTVFDGFVYWQKYRKSTHYAARSRSAGPRLSYESLNELRYVSRLTKAAITWTAAGRVPHALKQNILILGPVNGTFASRYRFSHATAIAAIYAVYFHLPRPTSE